MTNSEKANQASEAKSYKLLVLALSGIGNFLMQSPAIEALKATHPNYHITAWVAPRGTRSLAKRNKYVDEVIEEPIKRSPWGHLKLVWRLRQQKFDTGIVLSPGNLLKSAVYLTLAGIPKRIGNSYPLFGREVGFLLTDAIPEDSSLHDIEQNLNLLKPLGIPQANEANEALSYKLTIPLSSQRRADDLVSKFHISTSQRLVGFHAGSAPNLISKRWPRKYWVELGKALAEKNYHVLIFGGNDETKLKRKLKAGIGKPATTIETDLFTTAAVMQKCEFMVSNDSGLMHLAAAAGVKTFGLFGPTDERQTGPRGEDSYAIRAPGTAPSYHTEKNFDLGTKPHETMQLLQPSYVLSRIFA